MKRSTTPAFREKPLQQKSILNLKGSNQLKLCTKQSKKPIISKPKPTSIANPPQLKPLRLFTQQKLISSQLNPQSSILQYKAKESSPMLTQYLISKCWANSEFILSDQVNNLMRKHVIQWLVQLSHQMKLKRETLFHAVWIFERCIQKISDLNSKNLQLLIITCLFISAKYQQIYPPHVLSLLQKTMHSYSKNQIINLQQQILSCLSFQLCAPNRHTFLYLSTTKNSFLNEYNKQTSILVCSKRFNDLMQFLLEISLLKSWGQDTSQKQIADAVIFLASKVMKKYSQIQNMQNWAYATKIQQVSYQLVQLWKNNKNSIVCALYDSDRYSFVGGLNILY